MITESDDHVPNESESTDITTPEQDTQGKTKNLMRLIYNGTTMSLLVKIICR